MVDLLLGGGTTAGHLGNVNYLHVFSQPLQNSERCQAVDHDDIGLRERAHSLDGHQPRIARAAAYNYDPSVTGRRSCLGLFGAQAESPAPARIGRNRSIDP